MFDGSTPGIVETRQAIAAGNGRLTSTPVRALHFGPARRRLLGIVDEPAPGEYSGRAVVLCYPQGLDYASAFRSFRVLATRLRSARCRVLRFDYFGTGDSAGDLGDASIEQWVGDVGAAVREMEALGAAEVALVGLRLGATLAALSAAKCESVARLVLWEPVLDGARYLADLRALHDSWLMQERRNGRRVSSTGDDLFADRWPSSLREELARMDLSSLPAMTAPVRLLWQSQEPGQDRFASCLLANGTRVETTRVDGPAIWSRSPVMPDAPVPNRALQSIVSLVTAEP
jgi:pimeloyl-ACP methyl ester carboxylesterase